MDINQRLKKRILKQKLLILNVLVENGLWIVPRNPFVLKISKSIHIQKLRKARQIIQKTISVKGFLDYTHLSFENWAFPFWQRHHPYSKALYPIQKVFSNLSTKNIFSWTNQNRTIFFLINPLEPYDMDILIFSSQHHILFYEQTFFYIAYCIIAFNWREVFLLKFWERWS